jgi:hypothetical protein
LVKKLLLTAFFVCLIFIKGYGLNVDSTFTAANRAYDNKDYEAALNGYLELEKSNNISAPLYFNTGNCYFRQGKLGYAILYYLRAKRLSPRDDDIAANLAFARQFMPTSLEGVKINPVASFFDSLVAPFTLNGLAWTASMAFIIFMLFLSAVVFFQWRGFRMKMAGYVLLVLVLASSGMTTYKYRTDYMTPKGVIVADEAQVYSGPGEDNDLEFLGAYGLTFEIEKSLGDYYRVIFENQRKGWIKKSNVEII